MTRWPPVTPMSAEDDEVVVLVRGYRLRWPSHALDNGEAATVEIKPNRPTIVKRIVGHELALANRAEILEEREGYWPRYVLSHRRWAS